MKWKLASLVASVLLSATLSGGSLAAADPSPGDIRLELSPRLSLIHI